MPKGRKTLSQEPYFIPPKYQDVLWQSYDNLQPVRVIKRDGKPVVQEERTFRREGTVTWADTHWEDSKDPQIVQITLQIFK